MADTREFSSSMSTPQSGSANLDITVNGTTTNYNPFGPNRAVDIEIPQPATDVVKYGEAQTLTDTQKTQARSNIGAGDASFQRIVFTLNKSPFVNPTSATCDTAYSDIITRWQNNNELPVANLSWSGSGNQSIYASSFEFDQASAEVRFVFVMYGGLLLELVYRSNNTIVIRPDYYRIHRNYEEYRVQQNNQGSFSRNFNWTELRATLQFITDGNIISRFEYPHILLEYNRVAEPTRVDYLFKLEFAKEIIDTGTGAPIGYQFSCVHRANYGTGSESSVMVTYTIWSDNTDGINAYTL